MSSSYQNDAYTKIDIENNSESKKETGSCWTFTTVISVIIASLLGLILSLVFGAYVGITLGVLIGWFVGFVLLLIGLVTLRTGVCDLKKCGIFIVVGALTIGLMIYFLLNADVCAYLSVAPTFASLSTEAELVLTFDLDLSLYNPNYISFSTTATTAILCETADCNGENDILADSEMDPFDIQIQSTTLYSQTLNFTMANSEAFYVQPCEDTATSSVLMYLSLSLSFGSSLYSIDLDSPGVAFEVPCIPLGYEITLDEEPIVIAYPDNCTIPE